MSLQLFSNSFIENLRERDDQLALFSEEGEISNRELYEQSVRLAIALHKNGATAKDRAIIASKPGTEFLQTIYATMLLGMMVSIIDPHMGRENYKKKLIQFGSSWAFVDARLLLLQEHPIVRTLYTLFSKKGIYVPIQKDAQYVATGPRLPLVRSLFKKIRHIKSLIRDTQPTMDLKERQKPYNYLVTYTSGTTNEPKGVLHSLEGLERSIEHIIGLLGDPSSQKIATHLPHFMLIGVTAGIPVFIWEEKWSISHKLEYIEKHQITTLFGPPAEFQEIMLHLDKRNQSLPSSIEHIILGSAPIYASFLNKFLAHVSPQTKVTCMYGMTENLIVSHVDARLKIKTEVEGDLLGKLVEGVEAKISEEGEILLKSDQMFSHYLHMKKRSEWHETGDLGKLTEHGLVMTGRKKNMIIRKNFNIYPALYESIIESIPAIENAKMLGIYNEEIADEIVYLVCTISNPISAKKLMDLLTYGPFSIDRDALPDEIVFLDKIPRSGRQQKVDYDSLRQEILRNL